MHRILVPVDEDEQRAERVAAAVNDVPCADEAVEVVLFNVDEGLDVPADGEGGVVEPDELFDETNYPPAVDRVEGALDDAGIAVSKRRTFGHPAEEILDVADAIDADRILMSGQPRSPAGKALLGSVTQSVVLDSTIPVTVVMSD